MAEPTPNPTPANGAEPPAPAKTDPTPAPAKSEPSAPSVEEQIKAAVDNAKKEWQAEQDEAARLAKLNKDEREKEERRIEREKFEKEKADFQHERLVSQTGDLLAERGLSRKFAERLCGKDAEETKANIDVFESDFNAAVKAAVEDKLKGNPPKDSPPPNPGSADPFLAGFGN